MGRNNQVSRILRVIHYLDINPQGLKARDILGKLNDEGFNCSRETVYRDLKAIQQALMPLEQDGSGDTAVWKLSTLARVNKGVVFSYNEILALFIARESMRNLHGSPVYEVLEELFLKLEKLLGPRSNEAMQEFAKYLGFKAKATWYNAISNEILDTLHAACTEHHYVEIEYQSVSGNNKGIWNSKKLGPESLYFADSGLYLIAYDEQAKKHKTYALNRIRKAVMLEEEFSTPGFEVQKFMNDNIGVLDVGSIDTVEIFLKEPIASYIAERRWHTSQNVVRTSEGVTLKLEVKINDELARWILSLGESATVVGPLQLIELVKEQAESVASKYNAKKVA